MSRPIAWWTPVMGSREKELLAEVVDSNFPNDGALTTAFENQVAELCGTEHAVATTSGTSAIFLGLAACGVGPGDEVLVPDVTFIATANAVSLTGAKPVLVDVAADTLCLDPARAAEAVTPRSKAVVPVHVSGRAADMPAILSMAATHGLAVVEDAAEAFGSRGFGSPLGGQGDVGCFSFTANKMITTGQGGMAVTDDADIHRNLRMLKDQGRPLRGTGGDDTHERVGYNFKFTDLQAAMGLAQLESLDQRRARQRRTYRLYRDRLADVSRITVLPFDLDGGACPLWVDVLVDGRDDLHDFLAERGIETRKFWHPLHTQGPYRVDAASFPISARLGGRALWLPTAFTMTDDRVSRVCDGIREWAQRH